MITVPGVHKRIPNGILGLLCKLHYPGCMEIGGQLQPASLWDHYIAANDVPDQEDRLVPNKAQRVLHELWVRLLTLHSSLFDIDITFVKKCLCSLLCAGLLQMGGRNAARGDDGG